MNRIRAPKGGGGHGECRNSNRDFAESERLGLCPACDGRGELISTFGGRHVHVPCPDCTPSA